MFGTVRKHSQPLWIVIIIMVVISFVVYFTPGYDPLDNRGGPAQNTNLTEARDMFMLQTAAMRRVDPSRLAQQEQQARTIMQMAQQQNNFQLMQAALQQLQQLEQMKNRPSKNDLLSQNQNLDLNQDGVQDVDYDTWRAHMRIRQLNKAHALGIRIGRDTAVKWNEANFQNNGRFSAEAFDKEIEDLAKLGYLPAGEQGKEIYREMIRQFLTLQQLEQLMSQSGGLFPDEFAADALLEEKKEYTTHAVFFSRSNHLTQAKITATNASSLTNIQKHYETLVDQYAIPAKRRIGFVKFGADHFKEMAMDEIDIKTDVEQRLELHNSSTNKFDHLLDDNGTKLPPGPALQLAAREAVQNTEFFKHRLYLSIRTNHLVKEAESLHKEIYYTDPPKELAQNPARHWSIIRLKNLVEKHEGKVPLQYQEAEVADPSSSKADNELPFEVVNTVYGPRAAAVSAKGLLYELQRPVEVSGEGFYIIGYVDDIPGRTRSYGELNEDEQREVQDSFAEAEADRMLDEEVLEFSEGINALLEAGTPFGEAIKDTPYHGVNLSPLTLGADTTTTNELNQLEGHAPLSSILTAVRNGADAVKAGWTSDFTRNPAIKSDGFLVHVSDVTDGTPPSPVELTNHADQLRRQTANTPIWFQSEMTDLRNQLAAAAVAERLKTIDSDIAGQEAELKQFQLDIENFKKNPNHLPEGITPEDLEKDLEANQKAIQKLKDLKVKLQNSTQPATGN